MTKSDRMEDWHYQWMRCGQHLANVLAERNAVGLLNDEEWQEAWDQLGAIVRTLATHSEFPLREVAP